MRKFMLFLVLCVLSGTALAESKLTVHKIDNNIYALVGELTQRSPSNLGNNSTHGVIITEEGVVLVDSGASYLGAKQIHETIQTLTNKPVKIVINSGGQDHRWLGNDYFKKQGAKIISSAEAKTDHQTRADQQLVSLENLIGDSLQGTEPAFASMTFSDEMTLTFGGVNLELYYIGPAHTPGDILIWLPDQQVMFSGDVVYNNRMLGIGPARNSQSWMKVFEKMASFKPKHIIPGHGDPSDLETATKNTYEYLKFIRAEVGKILENDGDMIEAGKIDQSKYHYLVNHESIAGRNALWVFEQMEFDY